VRLQATSAPPEGGLSYKAAGVDIDAGDELVRRIQKLNPSIGGFSGLVPFGDSYLVAGTDGVGTKLKLAFDMNKHDTVGIDLVAMSVNDIITSGAQPLFFLDYFATGFLDVDTAEQVSQADVMGLCLDTGCSGMLASTKPSNQPASAVRPANALHCNSTSRHHPVGSLKQAGQQQTVALLCRAALCWLSLFIHHPVV
jgi:hypothetical protein